MKVVKVAMAGGLVALGGGILITGFGAVDESLRWIGVGLTVALMGLASLWAGTVLIQRRQLQRLDQLRKVLGSGSPDFNTAIRNEVDEVVRVVDARILGLFEVLGRERSGPDDARMK
jgi:hypothetical protein